MEIINANGRNMNMLNKLLGERKAIVFFVAPWCGHCKQLEPTIDSLMGRFKNYKSPGLIARVEEKEIPKVSCDNEIRGYPTIRVLSHGKKLKDYEGPRDESSIANMLVKFFNEKATLKTQVDKEKEKKVKKKAKKKTKKKRKKKRIQTKRKKKRKQQKKKRKQQKKNKTKTKLSKEKGGGKNTRSQKAIDCHNAVKTF